MSTTAQKHIAAFTIEAWGHARPLVNLSARIVKMRPAVTFTFLTTNGLYQRAKTELSRSFDEGDEEAASRVRVISIGEGPNMKNLASEEFDDRFATAWATLTEGRELVCAGCGTPFPALAKPQALILDCFATEPFRRAKAIIGDTVKIFAWYAGLVYALFHLYGPESLGGKSNLRLKAEAEAQRTGKTFNEALLQLLEPSGKVVRIPGMLPMYDWEYSPQEFPMHDKVAVIVFPRIFETLESVDGILLFTPESYEPEATKAARGWFAEKGRPAYVVGPLLPSASKATATVNEKKLSSESTQIQAFLDETLKTSGEASLVYISFGSMFWPQETPEKVWAFLDVIMKMNIPFILSHASPFAVVPGEVQEKVKAYGKGILSPWTPQQLILEHPATGWFVAHGGHNGITEAISAGVPQILWPFGGDQPLNAVHIADQLKIGYELLEVRSGKGLKPIYRTGYTPKGTIEAVKAEARDVLTKAFGEDGAEKRARLEAVRAKVTKEWDEGGKSREDVLTFVDSL